MAKKKSRPTGLNKRIKERDKVTLGKVVELADDVATCAFKGRDICLSIPQRTRSNTLWNKKQRILQMGSGKSTRELFNLNQAKQFMQTMLHGNSIKELIEAEKTLSLRGMFYKGLHTVAGTKEKTFNDQGESDGILEDLEVAMGSLREELHIFAENRGAAQRKRDARTRQPYQHQRQRRHHENESLVCTCTRTNRDVQSDQNAQHQAGGLA